VSRAYNASEAEYTNTVIKGPRSGLSFTMDRRVRGGEGIVANVSNTIRLGRKNRREKFVNSAAGRARGATMEHCILRIYIA
jgi:hypothetical protein